MKQIVVSSFIVVLVAALMAPGVALAQEKFPSKQITLIIPYAAGGSTDLLARAVEKIWPKYAPQSMVLINKTGGGGVTGTEFVVRSKPDGYTLFMGYGSGSDIVMPHLQKMPYDPYKDIVAICRLSVHSVVIVTGAKSEFNSVKDMIAWAKKEGKPVTSSVSTAAGAVDIALRGLGKAAGINIVTVPSAGGADAVTMLAGGHVMIGGGHPRRSCRTSRPAASRRSRWPCPIVTRHCPMYRPSGSRGSISPHGARSRELEGRQQPLRRRQSISKPLSKKSVKMLSSRRSWWTLISPSCIRTAPPLPNFCSKPTATMAN